MHVARDFVELEILQSNPSSANKFCEASIRKIKKILIDDLTKFSQSQFNFLLMAKKIIRSETAEYSF